MKRRRTRGVGTFPVSDDDLFTAPEVAAFCKVDLKTIHNWVERGQIQFFRTPGRHLRFRRADVKEFLERFSYPIPEELKPRRPRLYLLEKEGESGARLLKMLSATFETSSFSSPMDLLLAAGAVPPDAVLIGREAAGSEVDAVVRALRRNPLTASSRIVAYAQRDLPIGEPASAGMAALLERQAFKDLGSLVASVPGK